MKKKIFVIFICMLLIATALPSISGSVIKKANFDDIQDYEFVPGEFIVKFTDGTKISNPSITVLNEKYQVSSMEKVFRNSENTILDNIYLLRVSEDSDILSIVNDYSSCLDVVYAEPNGIVHLCGIPNDENFSKQWALHNTGQSGGTPDADIDAPEAWDIETGESDVVIAIIDGGVDWDHPDLAANIWSNFNEILDGTDTDENGFIDDIRGWDFAYDDNDPMDDNGHGTCCAGIASADTDNNVGMAGICWTCKIMAVKVLYSDTDGTTVDLADGITYTADNDADVLSMSLGGYPPSSLLKNAVDYAYSQGAVLVAAAGNGATDEKFYPASFDNVIAVAATNDKDIKIAASNYGSWVDVAAPGWDIYTTDLDDYTYFSYTSSAAPHVAGLAALLLSYNPGLTPDEVRSIIHDSTDWIDTDEYIGNGRINAHKALLIASGITVPPNKPDTPSGQNNGNIGTEYTYNTSTIDSDGDDVNYLFDWGDGTYSGWIGPFASGATGSATHKWTKQGNYQIKVKAKDIYGVESVWSDPLVVTMPRNKIINTPFLNFLQNHPNLFPILQTLLQRLGLQ